MVRHIFWRGIEPPQKMGELVSSSAGASVPVFAHIPINHGLQTSLLTHLKLTRVSELSLAKREASSPPTACRFADRVWKRMDVSIPVLDTRIYPEQRASLGIPSPIWMPPLADIQNHVTQSGVARHPAVAALQLPQATLSPKTPSWLAGNCNHPNHFI